MARTKAETAVQYFRNGKPITNPSVNSLSGVAYFYTKGIDGKDRVPVKRLEAILAKLGVKEPRTTEFEVTLPNGVVLAAKLATDGTRPAPAATPAAPGRMTRAAKIQAMKDEREAVKAWETAGGDLSDQPKPATPVTDAANAELADKEAKAKAERAARADANGKAPASRPARPQPKPSARTRAARKAS